MSVFLFPKITAKRAEDLRGCGGGVSTIPCNLANPGFYDVAVRRGVEYRM